jgi:hypothetical protein
MQCRRCCTACLFTQCQKLGFALGRQLHAGQGTALRLVGLALEHDSACAWRALLPASCSMQYLQRRAAVFWATRRALPGGSLVIGRECLHHLQRCSLENRLPGGVAVAQRIPAACTPTLWWSCCTPRHRKFGGIGQCICPDAAMIGDQPQPTVGSCSPPTCCSQPMTAHSH